MKNTRPSRFLRAVLKSSSTKLTRSSLRMINPIVPVAHYIEELI
jgi:hypothetical protein